MMKLQHVFMAAVIALAGVTAASAEPIGRPDTPPLVNKIDQFAYVVDTSGSAGCKPKVLIEQRVDYSHWVESGFGTSDCIIVTEDSLHVCVALWADIRGRDIPFTVNTDPGSFVDFSRDADGVIAYGAFVSAAQQSEWGTFEIPIEYYTADKMSADTRSYLSDYLETGELPDNTQLYLLVTASKNCNYFIAGTGSVNGGNGPGSLMYVDELSFEYD